MQISDPGTIPDAGLARRLVEARLAARPLPAFPGELPETLAAAYACQESAIALWPDTIAGWKVGRIPRDVEARYGQSRVAGPIFSESVWRAASAPIAFPVIDGGFSAVEGEFIFRLDADTPRDKTEWTRAEAEQLAVSMFIGIEIAGSPMAAINDIGPIAVASDFGNNAGMILGPELTDWRRRPMEGLICEAFIDGKWVGRGAAASIPGGPIESLRFLVEHCARRGRPLRAGQYVSTGAVSGVHDIRRGQTARAVFGSDGAVACVAEGAQPIRR